MSPLCLKSPQIISVPQNSNEQISLSLPEDKSINEIKKLIARIDLHVYTAWGFLFCYWLFIYFIIPVAYFMQRLTFKRTDLFHILYKFFQKWLAKQYKINFIYLCGNFTIMSVTDVHLLHCVNEQEKHWTDARFSECRWPEAVCKRSFNFNTQHEPQCCMRDRGKLTPKHFCSISFSELYTETKLV